MRRVYRVVAPVLLVLMVLAASVAEAADKIDYIALARTLYNKQDYVGAVDAAEKARTLLPARADSADLIAARAYLERFSQRPEDTVDLTNARDRLRRLNPERLTPAEKVELAIGIGEALYFENSVGAAAVVFDSILERGDLGVEARERLLDWWATAVDRDAQPPRSDFERQSIYQRVRDRMRRELGANPGSGAASYWLAAAAKGQGDWQAAWDAALAGWLLSPQNADGGTKLRSDLDHLMELGILPQRARNQARSVDALRGEWDEFKIRWQRDQPASGETAETAPVPPIVDQTPPQPVVR